MITQKVIEFICICIPLWHMQKQIWYGMTCVLVEFSYDNTAWLMDQGIDYDTNIHMCSLIYIAHGQLEMILNRKLFSSSADRIRTVVFYSISLQWRHNGHDGVSNLQPHYCLLNGLFRCRSKKTSKLRITGLCVANSPVTGEFPAQMVSNAEKVSIWWRHHAYLCNEDLRTSWTW